MKTDAPEPCRHDLPQSGQPAEAFGAIRCLSFARTPDHPRSASQQMGLRNSAALALCLVVLQNFGAAAIFYVLFASASLFAEEPVEDLQKLVIPVGQYSSAADKTRIKLAAAFSGIKPNTKAPRSFVTKDGRFILYGDLFKSDGCFALFELPVKAGVEEQFGDAQVGLAEWSGRQWELRGLWNISSTWRPKGWKSSDDDYLPITPATEPFELRDMSGDGVPEVIIAGDVEKYFQSYYLLRFDPKTRGLSLLAYAMGKPECAGEYVRLYSNSGRRAIFEEWEYLRWAGDKLVHKASWHDESPYDNHEPPFIVAEVMGGDRRSHSFRITDADNNSQEEIAYTITKDEKPYATFGFVWREPLEKAVGLAPDQVGHAWLFEKITGIPCSSYPLPSYVKKLVRLEDYATIRVTGSDEAKRMLSLKTQKTQRR